MKKLIVIPILLLSHILLYSSNCMSNYQWCMSWAQTYYEYDLGQCNWWNYNSCRNDAWSSLQDSMGDCEDGYWACRSNEE